MIRANDTIHSIIHIDRPTASLVLQTGRDIGIPQHTYLHPGIGYARNQTPTTVRKVSRILQLLYRTDPDDFWGYFRRQISLTEDLASCYLAIECCDFADWKDVGRLANIVAEAHPRLDGLIQTALLDAVRETRIRDSRCFVHNTSSRLLLALLATKADRRLAIDIMGQARSRSLTALSLPDAIGMLAAESDAEQLEALLGYPLASANVRVLAELVAGRSEGEIARGLATEIDQPTLLEDVQHSAAMCRASLFSGLL